MGMRLPEMHQFAKLPPAERLREGLAGGRLPTRGFYRVKTVSREQLQDANAARKMTSFQTPTKWSRFLRVMSCSELSPMQTADQADAGYASPSSAVPGNTSMNEPAKEVQITIRDL